MHRSGSWEWERLAPVCADQLLVNCNKPSRRCGLCVCVCERRRKHKPLCLVSVYVHATRAPTCIQVLVPATGYKDTRPATGVLFHVILVVNAEYDRNISGWKWDVLYLAVQVVRGEWFLERGDKHMIVVKSQQTQGWSIAWHECNLKFVYTRRLFNKTHNRI